MAMEIKPGRHISRMLFVGLTAPKGNVVAFLYRDPAPDDAWHVHLRLRFYVDNDMSRTSKDPRKVAVFSMQDRDLDTVVEKTRKTVLFMAHLFGPEKLEELVIESADPKVISEKFHTVPWMNFSTEKISQEGAV